MIQNEHHGRQRPRTLIVTGGSSGIGRAAALKLSSEGHTIIAIGRDAARLSALKLESPGIITVAFDFSRVNEIAALVTELLARFSHIDGLINNAGVQDNRRMNDPAYHDADIINEIATNLIAPIALARGLLPHLLVRPNAVICNVTSGLAFAPKRTSAVYSATKAGLHLFSKALRVQLGGTNVRIVEVVMPLVDTPMTAGRGTGKLSPDRAAEALCKTLWQGPETVHVGKTRCLPPLLRIAPGIAERLMQRGT